MQAILPELSFKKTYSTVDFILSSLFYSLVRKEPYQEDEARKIFVPRDVETFFILIKH